jgi:hypothetical protein
LTLRLPFITVLAVGEARSRADRSQVMDRPALASGHADPLVSAVVPQRGAGPMGAPPRPRVAPLVQPRSA